MGLVLALDATTLFDFHQTLKQQNPSAQSNIDYRALLDGLNQLIAPDTGVGRMIGNRDGSGHGDGSGRGDGSCFERMIAFASINREHEGQQKFCAFLRSIGFTVDETDYRDAFINPDRSAQQYQRLSTRIAYLAGLLVQKGRNHQPHLVVVTDAFDVYYPLVDYVQRRGGQATIAFFRSGMEERWSRVGLFDNDSPVMFQDLSEHSERIMGVDLSLSSGRSTSRDGLASLEF